LPDFERNGSPCGYPVFPAFGTRFGEPISEGDAKHMKTLRLFRLRNSTEVQAQPDGQERYGSILPDRVSDSLRPTLALRLFAD
jgi:hypothetical protein